MIRKKVFGIGIVGILLFVAITPVVNGIQRSIYNRNSPLKTSDGGYDLDITLESIKAIGAIEIGNSESIKVLYEIKYTIKNVGREKYAGAPLIKLYEEKTEELICFWVDDYFELNPGDKKSRKYIQEVISDPNYDSEKNIEKKFAAKNIIIEAALGGGADYNPNSNYDIEFSKFWNYYKNEGANRPTITQILHTVNPENWIDHYEYFEGKKIPVFREDWAGAIDQIRSVIKSNHLGWVAEGMVHLIKISGDIFAMIVTTSAFLVTISEPLKIIIDWLNDVIFFFTSIANGVWIPGLLAQILHDLIWYVIPAADTIVAAAIAYGGAMSLLAEQLEKHIDDFENWKASEPWYKPVKIYGECINIDDRKQVKIYLGDKLMATCEGSNNKAKFEFYRELGEDEKPYFIHNCRITARYKDQVQQSKLIHSWAFSNGSFYWTFYFKDGGERNIIKNINLPLLNKIKEWFKNKPLLKFFTNVFTHKMNNKKETKVNRDFNLDNLMKIVLEENEQQPPYENLVYREYSKDATWDDPNTVYYGSEQVIVAFKESVDVTKLKEVEGYPVVDVIPDLNVVIVEIIGISPEDFIELVESRSDVYYAEENFVYHTCWIPNDPYWEYQWGPKAIKCPQAWDIQKGIGYVKIAIVDTGVDYKHEDRNYNWDYKGYDFVNDDAQPMDDCYVSHGTHCAGIASAQIDNRVGIAGIADVSIIPIKVMDGDGVGYAFDIAKGIVYAAQNDAHVISMSLGGYGSSILVRTACEYAYTVKRSLIVAAAGNNGIMRICYPARFDTVIAVGAVDKTLKRCEWSNYGPELDLVAPGDNIYSTIKNNRYRSLSGTSMATPHVAGVAGLYYSENPTDDVLACKAKIFSSAIDLGKSGKDIEYGYGLVNAYGTVKNKGGTWKLFVDEEALSPYSLSHLNDRGLRSINN